VRRSRLLKKKQAKLVSNSFQDVSANSDLKESNDNFEDVLTSNDDDLEERNENVYYCEGNNEDKDFEALVNNNSLEYNNTDDYLEESSNDFESITFHSDSLESSNDDLEDSTNDCETSSDDVLTDYDNNYENNSDDVLTDDDNLSAQEIADGLSNYQTSTVSTSSSENIRCLRSQRIRMPLLTIKSHTISINNRKMASTSKPTKLAYTISIKEHLNQILNNSRLMAKIYFGHGIKCQEKSELWHGNIYQERSHRGHKELWMIEENYKIIPPSYVLRHISVWIEDVSQPASYNFYISEILYKDAITKEFYTYIKLHIGDVVIIKEEDNESYAIIRAIFTHKYNNRLIYAFV
ncbi:3472_t:CDS:2, partial [Dentiscutata erythropus]